MINGLIPPTKGDIWVNQKNIQSQDLVQWRRQIGYVVQKGGLLPHLTVYENLSLLSKVMNKDPKDINNKAVELMDVINMSHKKFFQRYPHELSGGQSQKISIIRALMEDPSIILMDEPFSALDRLSVHDLYEEFSLLNQKFKKTILFVSHNLKEAFSLSDRVMLMRDGRIEQVGTKETFLTNPKTQYVKQFMEDFLDEK